MFIASRNLGIYYELQQLIEYIEDDEDLNLLDNLLVKFRKEGLTDKELRLSIELIEEYLPIHIECDSGGCYVTQEIDGIPANTYFSDLETERQETNVVKTLLLV